MSELSVISINQPKSAVSEAYRTLRTNIEFSSFDDRLKVIVVTSSGPGEGKSTTAANLAVSFANANKRTILIDTDLRKPVLHKYFNCSNQKGLTNMLIDEVKFEDVICKTDVENLFLLPCGTKPPNPSELIGSTRMESFIEALKQSFDYIILDSPPVVAVTDAQVLSKFVDGYILVIASGITEKLAAIKARDLLNMVNAKILGVVLNKVDVKSKKGYYGYKYYGYYGEEEKSDRKTKKKSRKKDKEQGISC